MVSNFKSEYRGDNFILRKPKYHKKYLIDLPNLTSSVAKIENLNSILCLEPRVVKSKRVEDQTDSCKFIQLLPYQTRTEFFYGKPKIIDRDNKQEMIERYN